MSGSLAFIGGPIGYCHAKDGPCNIENSVNMGNVSFRGSLLGFTFSGGLIGLLDVNCQEATVKNCANYGSVTFTGESKNLYMGGAIGTSQNYYQSHPLKILNSLNYGNIAFNGTISVEVFVGGFVGMASSAELWNCLSYGTISSTSEKVYIGGIVTGIETSLVSNCYWNEEIGPVGFALLRNPSITETSSFDKNFVLNESVSVGGYQGTSLIEALNTGADYYGKNDCSHWIVNKDENAVSFKVNSVKYSLTLSSRIILLPSLTGEKKLIFSGWYMDSSCTTLFTKTEIDEKTELYGKYEEDTNYYTISFDLRGNGEPIEPIVSQYFSLVELPRVSPKANRACVFAFWETDTGDRLSFNFIVPARNITLFAVWGCTHIENAGELVGLSKAVNSETANFSGTTVFLDSDIDFSEELSQQFKAIGENENQNFLGEFDGQGHTISNLKANSSSGYPGLFGHSRGLTIRNVVLDDSCFVYSTSTYATGGFISQCYSMNGACIIENSVNMANVTFRGNAPKTIYIGGFTGNFKHYKYESFAKNCANYGSVTYSGTSESTYIGGIMGNFYHTEIQNSFNYGAITYNGITTNALGIGGIIGYGGYSTAIENCVSAGRITSSKASYDIGSICGYTDSLDIKHSFWTSSVGFNKTSGSGTKTVDAETSQVELNTELLNRLNNYSSTNSWNKWFLNNDNASVFFKINDYKGFTVDSQIVLFPDLVDNNERTFSGWYSDEGLAKQFTASEVVSDTTLYGLFCGSESYTTTLDVNGGDELAVPEVLIKCNGTYETLPIPTRTEATFEGWFTARTGGVKIESGARGVPSNRTLYAHWTVNSYTLTFDLGNGTIMSNTLEYGTAIEYPGGIEREGYTFAGWDNDIAFMPAENLVITANWTVNSYTLTFDLGNETMVRNTLEYGTTIEYPAGIEREGYTFAGWFADSAFTTPFTESNVTKDATIYAKYETKQGGSESNESASDESKKEGSFSLELVPLAILVFSVFML